MIYKDHYKRPESPFEEEVKEGTAIPHTIAHGEQCAKRGQGDGQSKSPLSLQVVGVVDAGLAKTINRQPQDDVSYDRGVSFKNGCVCKRLFEVGFNLPLVTERIAAWYTLLHTGCDECVYHLGNHLRFFVKRGDRGYYFNRKQLVVGDYILDIRIAGLRGGSTLPVSGFAMSLDGQNRSDFQPEPVMQEQVDASGANDLMKVAHNLTMLASKQDILESRVSRCPVLVSACGTNAEGQQSQLQELAFSNFIDVADHMLLCYARNNVEDTFSAQAQNVSQNALFSALLTPDEDGWPYRIRGWSTGANAYGCAAVYDQWQLVPEFKQQMDYSELRRSVIDDGTLELLETGTMVNARPANTFLGYTNLIRLAPKLHAMRPNESFSSVRSYIALQQVLIQNGMRRQSMDIPQKDGCYVSCMRMQVRDNTQCDARMELFRGFETDIGLPPTRVIFIPKVFSQSGSFAPQPEVANVEAFLEEVATGTVPMIVPVTSGMSAQQIWALIYLMLSGPALLIRAPAGEDIAADEGARVMAPFNYGWSLWHEARKTRQDGAPDGYLRPDDRLRVAVYLVGDAEQVVFDENNTPGWETSEALFRIAHGYIQYEQSLRLMEILLTHLTSDDIHYLLHVWPRNFSGIPVQQPYSRQEVQNPNDATVHFRYARTTAAIQQYHVDKHGTNPAMSMLPMARQGVILPILIQASWFQAGANVTYASGRTAFGADLNQIAKQYGAPPQVLTKPLAYYQWARKSALTMYPMAMLMSYNVNQGSCWDMETSLIDVWDIPKRVGGIQLTPRINRISTIDMPDVRPRVRMPLFDAAMPVFTRLFKARQVTPTGDQVNDIRVNTAVWPMDAEKVMLMCLKDPLLKLQDFSAVQNLGQVMTIAPPSDQPLVYKLDPALADQLALMTKTYAAALRTESTGRLWAVYKKSKNARPSGTKQFYCVTRPDMTQLSAPGELRQDAIASRDARSLLSNYDQMTAVLPAQSRAAVRAPGSQLEQGARVSMPYPLQLFGDVGSQVEVVSMTTSKLVLVADTIPELDQGMPTAVRPLQRKLRLYKSLPMISTYAGRYYEEQLPDIIDGGLQTGVSSPPEEELKQEEVSVYMVRADQKQQLQPVIHDLNYREAPIGRILIDSGSMVNLVRPEAIKDIDHDVQSLSNPVAISGAVNQVCADAVVLGGQQLILCDRLPEGINAIMRDGNTVDQVVQAIAPQKATQAGVYMISATQLSRDSTPEARPVGHALHRDPEPFSVSQVKEEVKTPPVAEKVTTQDHGFKGQTTYKPSHETDQLWYDSIVEFHHAFPQVLYPSELKALWIHDCISAIWHSGKQMLAVAGNAKPSKVIHVVKTVLAKLGVAVNHVREGAEVPKFYCWRQIFPGSGNVHEQVELFQAGNQQRLYTNRTGYTLKEILVNCPIMPSGGTGKDEFLVVNNWTRPLANRLTSSRCEPREVNPDAKYRGEKTIPKEQRPKNPEAGKDQKELARQQRANEQSYKANPKIHNSGSVKPAKQEGPANATKSPAQRKQALRVSWQDFKLQEVKPATFRIKSETELPFREIGTDGTSYDLTFREAWDLKLDNFKESKYEYTTLRNKIAGISYFTCNFEIAPSSKVLDMLPTLPKERVVWCTFNRGQTGVPGLLQPLDGSKWKTVTQLLISQRGYIPFTVMVCVDLQGGVFYQQPELFKEDTTRYFRAMEQSLPDDESVKDSDKSFRVRKSIDEAFEVAHVFREPHPTFIEIAGNLGLKTPKFKQSLPPQPAPSSSMPRPRNDDVAALGELLQEDVEEAKVVDDKLAKQITKAEPQPQVNSMDRKKARSAAQSQAKVKATAVDKPNDDVNKSKPRQLAKAPVVTQKALATARQPPEEEKKQGIVAKPSHHVSSDDEASSNSSERSLNIRNQKLATIPLGQLRKQLLKRLEPTITQEQKDAGVTPQRVLRSLTYAYHIADMEAWDEGKLQAESAKVSSTFRMAARNDSHKREHVNNAPALKSSSTSSHNLSGSFGGFKGVDSRDNPVTALVATSVLEGLGVTKATGLLDDAVGYHQRAVRGTGSNAQPIKAMRLAVDACVNDLRRASKLAKDHRPVGSKPADAFVLVNTAVVRLIELCFHGLPAAIRLACRNVAQSKSLQDPSVATWLSHHFGNDSTISFGWQNVIVRQPEQVEFSIADAAKRIVCGQLGDGRVVGIPGPVSQAFERHMSTSSNNVWRALSMVCVDKRFQLNGGHVEKLSDLARACSKLLEQGDESVNDHEDDAKELPKVDIADICLSIEQCYEQGDISAGDNKLRNIKPNIVDDRQITAQLLGSGLCYYLGTRGDDLPEPVVGGSVLAWLQDVAQWLPHHADAKQGAEVQEQKDAGVAVTKSTASSKRRSRRRANGGNKSSARVVKDAGSNDPNAGQTPGGGRAVGSKKPTRRNRGPDDAAQQSKRVYVPKGK